MRYDAQKIFLEKYPELFDNSYFIEIFIMIGWEKVVDKALSRINEVVENMEPDGDHGTPLVVQIKEKFGGLRIYTSYHVDEIEKIIEEAEKEASETCEDCGCKQDVTTEGRYWVKTLCKICHDKKNKG